MFLGVSGSLEVGRRNVAALEEALTAAGLRLAPACGGGRLAVRIGLGYVLGGPGPGRPPMR